MQDINGSRIGLAAALTAALAFGINTVAASASASAGVAAPLIVVYRLAVMLAIVLAVIAIARTSLRVPRPAWPAMAALTATGAGMGIAYLSSVAFIPVTVAAVIFYTYPILIVLAGPLVTGRALNQRELVIAFVAFAGIALVVGPSFDSLDPRGLLLALLGSVFTTIQFFAANRLAAVEQNAKLFWSQLGALPIAAAVAFVTSGLHAPQALMLAPLPVAITIIGYVIGFSCMLLSLSRLNAAIAGLVFCLEPVVSAIVSAAWLGEKLNAIQYAGGCLVIAAVLATALAPMRALKPA